MCLHQTYVFILVTGKKLRKLHALGYIECSIRGLVCSYNFLQSFPYVIFYGMIVVLIFPSYFQLQNLVISHLFSSDECNTLQ